MRLLLAIAMLCIAMIACAEQTMEVIEVNSAPQTFILRGEVSHFWEISTSSGVSYQAIVSKVNSSHPANMVVLEVWASSWGEELISEASYSSADTIAVVFTGPDNGQIQIRVASTLGEGTEDLGTFSLEVRALVNSTPQSQ